MGLSIAKAPRCGGTSCSGSLEDSVVAARGETELGGGVLMIFRTPASARSTRIAVVDPSAQSCKCVRRRNDPVEHFAPRTSSVLVGDRRYVDLRFLDMYRWICGGMQHSSTACGSHWQTQGQGFMAAIETKYANRSHLFGHSVLPVDPIHCIDHDAAAFQVIRARFQDDLDLADRSRR